MSWLTFLLLFSYFNFFGNLIDICICQSNCQIKLLWTYMFKVFALRPQPPWALRYSLNGVRSYVCYVLHQFFLKKTDKMFFASWIMFLNYPKFPKIVTKICPKFYCNTFFEEICPNFQIVHHRNLLWESWDVFSNPLLCQVIVPMG